MELKCYKCKVGLKKAVRANELFGKYLISDVAMMVCPSCGEEFIEGEEYERIRKKIAALESSKTPQKALAQAKVVIL